METKNFCRLSKQNQIRGKVFYPEKWEQKSAGIIVLCHGIPSGKKDQNDPGYEYLAQTLTVQGYTTVIFNFRGAGESSGDFDLRGWAEDLREVVDFISPVSNSLLPVVLFGFSAGAAVAIYAFAHNDNRIKGLILCGCPANFDSLIQEKGLEKFLAYCKEIGIIKSPNFPYDLSAWGESFVLIRPEFWISQIKSIPKLILHGDQDEVVPIAHAYLLYEKALDPKELKIIKNAGHRLRLNEEAMKAAQDWLRKLF